MRVLGLFAAVCGVFGFADAALPAGDVFTLECRGRVYHFANDRFHGANDFYNGFTIDLVRMVWAGTDAITETRKIAAVDDDRIVLTSRYEASDVVAEVIDRKTLRYTRTLEFHQFREDASGHCRIVAQVPLPQK